MENKHKRVYYDLIRLALIAVITLAYFVALYINVSTPNRPVAIAKESKVLYAFYKLEPDGDFELFWENDKGWAYVQYLGGDIVEVKEFIGATEQDIRDFIGIRMCEFDYTESLESKGSLF